MKYVEIVNRRFLAVDYYILGDSMDNIKRNCEWQSAIEYQLLDSIHQRSCCQSWFLSVDTEVRFNAMGNVLRANLDALQSHNQRYW